MPPTDNGAPAYSNQTMNPVELLAVKVNGGVEFTTEVYQIINDAIVFDVDQALKVILHIGNSRGVRGKTPLRRNMDPVMAPELQTEHLSKSEASEIQGGMMNQVEWIKILQYLFHSYPQVINDNLAVIARNGCLRDLLELCIGAVYGYNYEDDTNNVAFVGSLGFRSIYIPYKSEVDLQTEYMLSHPQRVSRRHIQQAHRIAHAQKFVDTHPDIFPIGTDAFGTIFERRLFEVGRYDFKMRRTNKAEVAARTADEKEEFQQFTTLNTISDGEHIDLYRQWCVEQVLLAKQDASAKKKERATTRYDMVCHALGCDVATLGPDSLVSAENHVARLFQGVAGIFSTLIAVDLAKIAAGNPTHVSGLAAKWAPTPHGRHAKLTFMDEVIGNYICATSFDLMPRHGSYWKTINLVRKSAGVPELYMDDVSKMEFHRIASKAMMRYKKRISKEPAFVEFMLGKKTQKLAALSKLDLATTDEERQDALAAIEMAGLPSAALLPHEVIAELLGNTQKTRKLREPTDVVLPPNDDVIESQFSTMLAGVQRVSVDTPYWNLAMCDTSGSMGSSDSLPLNNAIALSIITAMSAPTSSPFHGRILTFTDQPTVCDIREEMAAGPLRPIVERVSHMDAGYSTDFEAAFRMVMELTKEHCMTAQDMAKVRLLVFSDMQFDQSAQSVDDEESGFQWGTTYDAIVDLAATYGYANFVPNIVFWNLATSITSSLPAPPDAKGVVQIAGYSAANLVAVMGPGMCDLKGILRNRAYDGIVVSDAVKNIVHRRYTHQRGFWSSVWHYMRGFFGI